MIIRRNSDLLLAIAWALSTVSVVLFLPSLEVLRIVVGAPFVLFLPGYSLLAALYPRRQDLQAPDRLALSFGLSIAVVLLIALATNYSPWGVRLEPVLVFVALFVVLTAAAAAARRWLLPSEQALAFGGRVRLPCRPRLRLVDGLLALVLVPWLAGLGALVYFVSSSGEASEGFTEFYLLGPGGRAEAYPGRVMAGEQAQVRLGVVNREGEDAAYRIAVRLDGESTDAVEGPVLADGERWEETVALLPTGAGNDQKAEFFLYKDGGSEPYRRLHLWLDVLGAPPDSARAQTTPSPTPATKPAATSPPLASVTIGPAGLIYLVQPGDTLTALSERFGLTPDAVAAANGMDTPEPILTGQELRIPGAVYTVQPGDTLADIAAAFGVPLTTIMAANAINDPNAISGGQRLAIPGGGVALPITQTPSATATPTPTSTATPAPWPAVDPM